MATTVSESANVLSVPAPASPEVGREPAKARGEIAIIWSRFRRHQFALIGLGALLFMLVVATVAPLAPWGPNEIDRSITEPQFLANTGARGLSRERVFLYRAGDTDDRAIALAEL